MENIVITGGLGYIGTELCNLYSGETRFKKVTVIDNRFVSERVRQLRDWGIDFVHSSILDKEKIKTALKNADVVYHLAGITDVAYTKTESNKDQDELITKVAVEGSRNVIELTSDSCKIIFPSTHVVFEGFEEAMEEAVEEAAAEMEAAVEEVEAAVEETMDSTAVETTEEGATEEVEETEGH